MRLTSNASPQSRSDLQFGQDVCSMLIISFKR